MLHTSISIGPGIAITRGQYYCILGALLDIVLTLIVVVAYDRCYCQRVSSTCSDWTFNYIIIIIIIIIHHHDDQQHHFNQCQLLHL